MSGTNHRSLLNSERLSSAIFRPAIPARNSPFAAGAQGLGWLSMATSVNQAPTPVRLPVLGQEFSERGVKLISPARMRLRLKKGGETDETYNESKALCSQCSMWLHEKPHQPMWYHIPERIVEMVESCPWHCAQAQCHGTTNAKWIPPSYTSARMRWVTSSHLCPAFTFSSNHTRTAWLMYV